MNFRNWTCLIWLPVYFKQNLGLSNEIFFRQHAVKFTFLSSIFNLYLSLPNNVWRLIVFAPFLIIISSGRHFNLKKLRREAWIFFWVFRMKNHDFTPKNHIFSNFRGGAPPLYINYYTGSLNLSRYIMCCILYWFPKSF